MSPVILNNVSCIYIYIYILHDLRNRHHDPVPILSHIDERMILIYICAVYRTIQKWCECINWPHQRSDLVIIFFVVVKVDRVAAKEEISSAWELRWFKLSTLLDGGKMPYAWVSEDYCSSISLSSAQTRRPTSQDTPGHGNTQIQIAPTTPPTSGRGARTWVSSSVSTYVLQLQQWMGRPGAANHEWVYREEMLCCVHNLAQKQKNVQEAHESLAPDMPLQRINIMEHSPSEEQPSSDNEVIAIGQKQKKKNRRRRSGTPPSLRNGGRETRQVRAVHGKGVSGRMEIWLYVPEHTRDKSATKRKGWWLYPVKTQPRHYYIGPLGYHYQKSTSSFMVPFLKKKHGYI